MGAGLRENFTVGAPAHRCYLPKPTSHPKGRSRPMTGPTEPTSLTDLTSRYFTKDDMPQGMGLWRQKHPIRAIRINGPFGVATKDGFMNCADGYIHVDRPGGPS